MCGVFLSSVLGFHTAHSFTAVSKQTSPAGKEHAVEGVNEAVGIE